jgi:hypothetical protein
MLNTISGRIERILTGVILAGFTLLALGFSSAPIFEGPDEYDHYQFVQFLIEHQRLPNPLEEKGRQYHQAPLYYTLIAPLAALMPDTTYQQYADRFNPFRGYLFYLPGNDNKNVYLHSQNEQFPYTASATAQAVHILRLISVGLGILTLLITGRIFRRLWPDSPARRILALGVLGFWPQFASMFGVISNDTLLFCLATLALWLILRISESGISLKNSALLGGLLGAALLTKISAVFLVVPVGVLFLLDRRTWKVAPVVLGVMLAVCGWWYVRNWILFGDPTGARALFELTQPGEAIAAGNFAPEVGLARLPFAYQTFWARFGDGRIPVGDGVYWFYSALTLVALIGMVMAGARQLRQIKDTPEMRRVLLVGVFTLAWIGLLVYYASRAANGHQGRYLLPGAAGWAALISAGWLAVVPRRFENITALSIPPLLAAVASVCLLGYFLPSYQVDAASAAYVPVTYRYGDAADLIGIEPPVTYTRPGEIVTISLIWKALHPSSQAMQMYLHTVEGDLVRRDSLPGTGNLLASDWQAGQVWSEQYRIQIPEDAEEQKMYTLVAGLYDPEGATSLPALDASGSEIQPVVGKIVVAGETRAIKTAYQFGNMIALSEPRVMRAGDVIVLCVEWGVITRPDADYQMFVHLIGADGQIAAQVDRPAGGMRYPGGVWSAGEAISECVPLTAPGLPSAGWKIALGLYDLATLQRLPAFAADHSPLPDNAVVITP